MTVIKRCEKEVGGTWDEKRQQAKAWLDHFVPHYCGRCLPGGGCPAKHSRIDDDSKRWLDEDHHKDKPRIPPLHQLIERTPDFFRAERAVTIAMDILLHQILTRTRHLHFMRVE